MSSQLTLDDPMLVIEKPDDNPHVVDDPEAVEWQDYHEFLRLRREQEAAR